MQCKRRCSERFHVNIKLVPVKAAYFLLMGALAMLLPYLPVFMGVLKITPTQMSIIIGTGTAVSAPVRLIIGYVADRLQKRNLVFATAALLAIIFYLSLYFTPSKDILMIEQQSGNVSGKLCHRSNYIIFEAFNETVTLNKTQNASELHFNMTKITCCSKENLELKLKCLSFSYTVNKDRTLVNVNKALMEDSLLQWNSETINDIFLNHDGCMYFQFCTKEFLSHFEPDGNQKTFWIFFILFFFAQITFSPLQNILDSLIYSFLSRSNRLEDFGKNRLWGTIGFGICACISGVVQDALSERGWKGRETYSISFITFCSGLFLAAIATLFIKVPVAITSDGNIKHKKISMVSKKSENIPSEEKVINKASKKGLIKNFCGFYLSVIMVTGMVAGILAGCLEGFFYYFLFSLDPNNKSVMGISLAIACVCEVVVLYFSGWIFSLVGYQRCLYIIFFVFGIRFTASSYIENPWYGLLTESTQCICFGLLYPIMSSWASALVSPQFQSTVQCYLGAIYFSLGRAVGAALAGMIYDSMGARIMFQIFAGIACGYIFVLIFIFEIVDRVRLKNLKKVKRNVMEIQHDQDLTINIKEDIKVTTYL